MSIPRLQQDGDRFFVLTALTEEWQVKRFSFTGLPTREDVQARLGINIGRSSLNEVGCKEIGRGLVRSGFCGCHRLSAQRLCPTSGSFECSVWLPFTGTSGRGA